MTAETSLKEWWSAHGDYTIRNLSSVIAQEYAPVEFNRNNLLEIPEYVLMNEFRPDASLSYERAYFSVAPRFTVSRSYYQSGGLDGKNKSDTEFYIQEWLAQVFLRPDLSLSYGREDLQWGPAFLLSPSNPFDSQNGRSEPKTEVAAADYVRLVWTPDYNWTFSLIANTDDGRKTYRIVDELRQDFAPGYALKADYVFDRGLASLIASTIEGGGDQDDRLGGYLSYNLSDAWIGYIEGSLSEVDEELLIGGSYTLESGWNLAVEYFYNSSGLSKDLDEIGFDEIETFIWNMDNREQFFRQRYLLVQAYRNDVYKSLDLIFRYTQNIDDRSRSFLTHLEFDITDNALGFLSGTLNSSGGGELDSLREYRVQAGIELVF